MKKETMEIITMDQYLILVHRFWAFKIRWGFHHPYLAYRCPDRRFADFLMYEVDRYNPFDYILVVNGWVPLPDYIRK